MAAVQIPMLPESDGRSLWMPEGALGGGQVKILVAE
jgi:hypothetical protein